jgi:hypothetical protein
MVDGCSERPTCSVTMCVLSGPLAALAATCSSHLLLGHSALCTCPSGHIWPRPVLLSALGTEGHPELPS